MTLPTLLHRLPPVLALGLSLWTAFWAYGYFYGDQPAGLALTLALSLLAWRVSRGLLGSIWPAAGERDLPYEAHWATPKEVKGYVVKKLGKAVVLGHFQQKLLGIKPGTGGQQELGHFLVCAPSRAGKGLHLIYNLLQWEGSSIVLDIKGENYEHTAGHRKRLGKVLVLDPSGRGNRYDPFAELGTTPEGLRAAAALILRPEVDQDPIFAQRAIAGLYAAMRAAQLLGEPTLLYLRTITEEGLLGYVEALEKVKHREVRRALVDFLGRTPGQLKQSDLGNDKFLASSWSNLTTRLQPFFSTGIMQMTSGSDFKAADLFDSPHSLYLIFRESELKFTGDALKVVLLALITAMIRHQDLSEAPPKQNILVAFDEATREPIPRLPDLVSTVAGRGLSALIYVQDLAQLEGAYDKSGARTIKNNCHTQIFYRPYDLDTARYISEMTDHTTIVEVEEMERLESKGLGADRRRSETFRMRSLITPGEARQLPRDKVIIFTQDRPPILADRLVYYQIPWAKAASQIKAPEVHPLPALPETPLALDRQAPPEKPAQSPSEEALEISKSILGEPSETPSQTPLFSTHPEAPPDGPPDQMDPDPSGKGGDPGGG